jgi:molecular chaperone DnaK (HSP70)
MENLLNIYHIVGIIVALSSILGVFCKIYVKSISNTLKIDWQKEINNARKSIEAKHEKDCEQTRALIEKESSTAAIKLKVKDFVEGEIKYLEQDIRQIKEISNDLKTILGTQQETLIAIQMSVTELKPRLDNLEERIQRLENKQ